MFWQPPLGPSFGLLTLCGNKIFQTTHERSAYQNLKAYLTAIPKFYRCLLSHHERIAPDLLIWRAFRFKRRLDIVADSRGLAVNIGTFGWQLLSTPTDILFQGSGPIDGPLALGTSTKRELGCFVAPLLLVAASNFDGWSTALRPSAKSK